MALDPEQIPFDLPDPLTHPGDTLVYYQHNDGNPPRRIEDITDEDRLSPVGPRLEAICLEKRYRDFAGLTWRLEYLRWCAGDGTKRRLHAGMIRDSLLLAVLEDMRRELKRPTELGQRHVEPKPEWMPVIEAHFAAVQCVHTVVGWAEYRPNRR